MKGIDRNTGKRLSGAAHLRQSVADILTTPTGSRVLRREYGSIIPFLIDSPESSLTRLRIIAGTATALAKWEPRLKVFKVSVMRLEPGQTEIAVDGINREDGQSVKLEGIAINVTQF